MADEHDHYDEKPDTYSAASEVARNLIDLYRLATKSMMENNLKSWWVYLDAVQIEIDWILKEPDRVKLEKLWKRIDPNDKHSYALLREYTLELRRLCKPFFIMFGQTGDPRKAVYR